MKVGAPSSTFNGIKPVFICGHPKAGTSLVRSLLDSHPELIVYPEETLFFRRFVPAAKGKSAAEKIQLAEKLLINIFEWNIENPPAHQVGYLDRDYAKTVSFEEAKTNLHSRLEGKDFNTGDLLEATLLAYGETQNLLTPEVKWWVEKSPYNEWFLSKALQWWPEARFIHVVRDPRDNFTSYRRKHDNWNADFFAKNWRRSTKSGLENQKRIGESSYWLLHFENMVTKPEETIEQLCDFLSIKDEPTLRIPTRAGETWQGNSMFSDEFDEISTQPIGRWEKELTAEDIYTIQQLCERGMKNLGYKLKKIDGNDIPFTKRMRIALEMAKLAVKGR